MINRKFTTLISPMTLLFMLRKYNFIIYSLYWNTYNVRKIRIFFLPMSRIRFLRWDPAQFFLRVKFGSSSLESHIRIQDFSRVGRIRYFRFRVKSGSGFLGSTPDPVLPGTIYQPGSGALAALVTYLFSFSGFLAVNLCLVITWYSYHLSESYRGEIVANLFFSFLLSWAVSKNCFVRMSVCLCLEITWYSYHLSAPHTQS